MLSEVKKDIKELLKIIRGEFPERIVSDIKTGTIIQPIKKEDVIEQLKKLGKLKEADVITEEEFLRKKQELLTKI